MSARSGIVAAIVFLVLLAVFATFWRSRNPNAANPQNGLAQLAPGNPMMPQQGQPNYGQPNPYYNQPLVVIPPQFMTVPTPVLVDTSPAETAPANTTVTRRTTTVAAPAPQPAPAPAQPVVTAPQYYDYYSYYPKYPNYPAGTPPYPYPTPAYNPPYNPSSFTPSVPTASRRYVYNTPSSCNVVSFTCSAYEHVFNDTTGCGCEKVVPVRRYLHRDAAVCSSVQFTCQPGERGFTDSTGCGCESSPYGGSMY